MADYHVEEYVREINLAAVKLARELADEYTAKNPDKPRFVAGSVGPTNKTCSMSPDVNNPAYRALSYDELAASYQQQMEAMLEGGVDAILIETIFDTLNAKAAIFAAEQAMKATGVEVPVMLSVTVSDIGRISCFRATCQYLFCRFKLFFRSPPIETISGTTGSSCTLLY